MTQQRFNETASDFPLYTHRSTRGYEVNGLWYFELRGGGQRGPFESEEEMQAELNRFIQYQAEMNQQI